MRSIRVVVVLVCLSTVALAQQSAMPAQKGTQAHVIIPSDAVKWGPASPALPPGAQAALLDGDPAKAGMPFTLRIKFPDGYKVAPHWHPVDEQLVVLRGTLMLGLGDKFEKSGAHTMNVGDYAKMPKEVRHFVWTKGETIIQLTAVGPFEVNYVNPADDPRQKTSGSPQVSR